jgi:hypothetical protein
MPYSIVCSLWISPDFSDVLAGRKAPPRLNHDQVNFSELNAFIKELFPYGPPVTIQVPNDTIDQVTMHLRQGQSTEQAIRCVDFGQLLLAAAKKQKSPVVSIRAAWKPLHALPERTFAPPPVLLPFVVTAADFEDAMLWWGSTRPSIGLQMVDIFEPQAPVEHQGHLPKFALQRLDAIFGSPFETHAVLDRMCADPAPAWSQ